MYEIIIDKEFENSADMHAVEREIITMTEKNSKLVKNPSKEILSLQMYYSRIYEIKNVGTILYRQRITSTSLDFHAEISLIGFNEDESEDFKRLKSGLEKFLEQKKKFR